MDNYVFVPRLIIITIPEDESTLVSFQDYLSEGIVYMFNAVKGDCGDCADIENAYLYFDDDLNFYINIEDYEET